MNCNFIDYQIGDDVFEAFVARPALTIDGEKQKCVLISHAWAGQMDLERDFAKEIAKMGYVGVAIDVYGKNIRGDAGGDNSHLMNPLIEDRAKLLARLKGALKFAQSLPFVDSSKIAIIGFCFGGLCALDLARSGTEEIKAAVSFHGLFMPNGLAPQKIKASVLALHGYEDPLAPPSEIISLGDELTKADADWQIHAFGKAKHAFTNPNANNHDAGLVFNQKAKNRAWSMMTNHLLEAFENC